MRKKTIAKIKEIINQTVQRKYWGNRVAMPYIKSERGDVTWDMIGGNPEDSNSLISYLSLTYYTKEFINDNFYTQEYLDEQFVDIYDKLTFPDEQGSVHLGYNASGNMYAEIDNDILNKINRAFLMPTATPTEFELVGFDTNKEQVRTKLGDGLEFDSQTKEIKVTSSFAQQQADWNQTDSSAVDYIKNKPTIPQYRHNIRIRASLTESFSILCCFNILSNNITALTTLELILNCFNNDTILAGSGYYHKPQIETEAEENGFLIYISVRKQQNDIRAYYRNVDGNEHGITIGSDYRIDDYVEQIH